MSGETLPLEQVRGLLEGITPGEWQTEPDTAEWHMITRRGHPATLSLAEAIDPADARLMAAAPALARTVLEQAAELERLRGLQGAVRKLVDLDARHRTFLEDALTWPTDAEFDAWAAEFQAVYSELAALASPAAAEAKGGEG